MDEITWEVPTDSGREFEVLPEDSYPATLWAVKTVDKPEWKLEGTEGEDRQQWEFIFEVQDPDYQGARLSSYINRSLHPKSNGFRYVVPLLARAPVAGETVRFSELVGRPCKITVKIKEKIDGTKYNKITDVLAPRGARNPMPLPTPEEFGADVTDPDLWAGEEPYPNLAHKAEALKRSGGATPRK